MVRLAKHPPRQKTCCIISASLLPANPTWRKSSGLPCSGPRPYAAFGKKNSAATTSRRLREIAPFGWVVDPAPLPPQGALPRLDVHSWDDVANFSQKERRLVLKISGFSELAWGSRGVHIGHDMPGNEWREQIEAATAAFNDQPRMMQQYHSGKIINHPYFDPDTGEQRMMRGRAQALPLLFTRS